MNLRLLAEKMGTDRAFFGVQAYGINTGETPYETISEMAAKDVAMIKQNQGDGPYTLWGYSFGARVAFEACYQLEQAGDEVENLYLIAPGSPTLEDEQHLAKNNEATFTNKKFLTILYSVFMGTINSHSLTQCLEVVDTKEKFINFICGLNNQLETGLVMRIIDIVAMTFEFTYSFNELKQRQLKAPIKIIKATGDDYSFIENNDAFSTIEPVIEQIEANHYSMLKTTHIDQLVAVL
jgi:thioesterase domain-containing protein